MMLKSGLYFALLIASVLAKGHHADINVQDNTIDDKKVEELLLKDTKTSTGLKKFATEYLLTRNLELSLEEAESIVAKVKDDKIGVQQQQQDFIKLLDMADLLRKKLSKCSSTKDKKVDTFLKNGLEVRELRKQLVSAVDGFHCPESGLATGVDYWSYVEDLKQKLRANPSSLVKEILSYMNGKGFLGKETTPMVTFMAGELVKNQEVVDFVLSFLDSLDYYFKSESGRRLVNLIPRLLAADGETAIELFAQEAEYNQETFIALLSNGDIATHFLNAIARFMITTFQWGKAALDDNLKLAVVNGMLISNNFPSLNRKKLLKSTVSIVEKALFVFGGVDTDALNLQSEVKVLTDEFERLYFRFDDFHKLSEPELVNVLSQFLKDNLLEPMKDSYAANRRVTSKDHSCGEIILCLFNRNNRKSNQVVRSVTKGLSWALAYSWTSSIEDLDYDRLHEAIGEGQKGEKKCLEIYESAPVDCDVFAQRRQQLGMNLNYEHNEL